MKKINSSDILTELEMDSFQYLVDMINRTRDENGNFIPYSEEGSKSFQQSLVQLKLDISDRLLNEHFEDKIKLKW